jgi:hypothetical protein
MLFELEDEHKAKEMYVKKIWEIKWGGGGYKISVTPWMEISWVQLSSSSCSKSLPQQDNSEQGMLQGSHLGLLFCAVVLKGGILEAVSSSKVRSIWEIKRSFLLRPFEWRHLLSATYKNVFGLDLNEGNLLSATYKNVFGLNLNEGNLLSATYKNVFGLNLNEGNLLSATYKNVFGLNLNEGNLLSATHKNVFGLNLNEGNLLSATYKNVFGLDGMNRVP